MYWCNLLDCCLGKKIQDFFVKNCSYIIRDIRRGQSLPLHRWFPEKIRPVLEGSCPWRGINMRSENKGKNTVAFPDIFPGQLGDNIYRFVKEFKEAISESQVKKADEVKTLQKYLGAEAKSKCRDHYPDLDWTP